MRRKLGLRILNPFHLLLMACAVGGLEALFQNPNNEHETGIFMKAYPYFIFGFGMFQRIQAWWALRKGRGWHTYYTGDSFFECYFPFLRFRNRFTKRFIDPAFAIFMGWLMSRYVSVPLGYWVIFAGGCLFWFEAFVNDKEVERGLDMSDGVIDAQMQSEMVDHVSPPKAQGQAKRGKSNVLPTGMAADTRRR